MAGLPAALLLVCSSIVWFLKKRPIRTIWIVTLPAFIIAWLLLIVLTQFLPAEFTLSNWRAQTVFLENIRFELNDANAALVAASLSLGAVIAFTFQGGQEVTNPMELIFLTLLGGFGLLTVIPDSYPTIAIMWIGWEVLTLLVYILNPQISMPFRHSWGGVIRRLASVVLVITIGAMLSVGRDGNLTSTPQSQVWQFLLGVFIVLLRMDVLEGESIKPDDNSRHPTLRVWIQAISTVSGLAFFSRLFRDGAPGSVHWLIILMGVGLCLIALLRMVWRNEIGFNLSTYALAIFGVGLILLRLNPSNELGTLETLSALLLLSISAMIVPTSFHPWNRVAGLAAALLALGIPLSIGTQITTPIVVLIQSRQELILATVSAITLALISLIPLRFHLAKPRSDQSVQEVSNINGAIIPVYILLSGMILGISTGTQITIPSVGFFVPSVVIVGVLVIVSMRRRIQFQISIPSFRLTRVSSTITSVLALLAEFLANAIAITARIFEGRAGLLWVYVTLLFILIAMGFTG